MATIGKLNYIISANTTQFVRAMVASRTEATLQRKILEQMRSPLDDWTEAQRRLNEMVAAGKLADDEYIFAMDKLDTQHPQAIANANAKAEADRTAAEEARRLTNSLDNVTRRLQEQILTYGESSDAVELYRLEEQGASADQLKQVASLQAEIAAMRQKTAAEREMAAAATAATAAAERRLAADMASAQAIITRHLPAQRQYAEQVKALAGLKREKHFEGNEAAYQAELERLKQLLPAIQAKRAAERDAAAELTRVRQAAATALDRQKDPAQRYREEIALLKQSGVSQAEFTARKRELAALLPQVQARTAAESAATVAGLEAERAAAQRAADVRKRVRDVVQSLNPAISAYRREVGELNSLLRRGALDHQTYQARVAQLRGELRQSHAVFGDFWKLIYQHPLLTAAAGLHLITRAARAFGAGVSQTMQEVADLNREAQKLGVGLPEMARLERASRASAVEVKVLADAMLELQRRGADPNLTPIQQLTATLDELRAIPVPMQRTIAAFERFGDKSKDLLPIINSDAAAYAQWKQAIEQPLAGDAGLGEIQAATEASRQLAAVWHDWWRITAAELAPEIVNLSRELQEFLSNAEVLQTLRTTMQNLAGAAGLVRSLLDAGAAALSRFNQGQQGLVALVHAAAAAYYKLRAAVAWMSGDQAGAKTWTQFAVEEMRSIQREMVQTQRTAEQTRNSVLSPAASSGPVRPATTPGVVLPAVGSADRPGKSLQQETNELVDSLQQQTRWSGASADELVRLKLEARGLGPEWLRIIGIMQQDLGVAQRTAEARAEVERMNAALREQIATQRMTADGWSTDQIERWQLAQRGAGAEQLEQLAILQQQAAGLKNQQDQQAAAAQKQQAATQQLASSLDETTKRLKEQIRTAGMNDQQLELDRLKELGATPEQLAGVAALQQRAKALQDVTQEQRTAIAATNGLSAATRGSSDALERVEAYRKMLASSGPRTPTVPPTVPTPVVPTVPPIAAAIQPTWTPPPAPPAVAAIPAEMQAVWSDILGPPAVPPIAAGIQPTWTPPPAPPALAAIPAEMQAVWGDILGPPAVPPIAAGIQPTWTPPPAPPAVPPIAAGIQPTWTKPPAPPALAAIPAEIKAVWGDILDTPPVPTIAKQAGRASDRRPEPANSSDASVSVLLGKTVQLLQRIANASEKEPLSVEQTA